MGVLFANSFEFMYFNEIYCCTCKKYVPYEQADDDNPVCEIENNIAISMFNEKCFPHEHVKRDSFNGLVYCTEWECE